MAVKLTAYCFVATFTFLAVQRCSWITGGRVVSKDEEEVVSDPLRLESVVASLALASSMPLSVKLDKHTGPGSPGRLVACLSTDLTAEPRLRVSTGHSGTTSQGLALGVDVEWDGSGTLQVDLANATGFPVAPSAVPPGRYALQAVLILYEHFTREGLPPVRLPVWGSSEFSVDADDYGWAKPGSSSFGNRNLLDAPTGIAFSRPIQVEWGSTPLPALVIDQRPAAEPPSENASRYHRRVSVRSALLSRFWGRPVTLHAWVLLPAGWHERGDAHYPMIVNHGHFSFQPWRGWSPEPPAHAVPPFAPSGDPDDCFYEDIGTCNISDSWKQSLAHDFYQNWTSLANGSAFSGRRVLLVRLQHSTPLFDDSYAVNSASMGPYGDAIVYELLPAVARECRGLASWARGLYGGSTGGWAALAQQVFYPREFNGAVGNAPDPVDFRALGSIDIYSDANAFHEAGQWGPGPAKPYMRDHRGSVLVTVEEGKRLEYALGSRGRSQEQLDVWAAVFSPVDADGYPLPLFDRAGRINRSVAQAWAKYDLRRYLSTNWRSVGPDLAGKLHVFVGMMDNFLLNDAAYRLEQELAALQPGAAEFRYGEWRGRGYGHAWSGLAGAPLWLVDATLPLRMAELLTDRFIQTAPAGADMSWRY